MSRVGFEELLSLHAAPTFAGLKAASLLSFRKSRFADFDGLLASYAACFACKGISLFFLADRAEFALILFYRAKELKRLLEDEEAGKILTRCGYTGGTSLFTLLNELRQRIQTETVFPHEIGIFLGYPPADVVGFMENGGRGFLLSGYWKVYAAESEARELFARYAACTKEFCGRLAAGESLPDMLMAG